MNKLAVGNIVRVDDMKFHEIEGGFGKNKKAMLVKEIAEIHGRPLFKINQLINDNRKHFIDGKDILDIKDSPLAILLKDSGIYTQNAINASTNIYILSERGYAKLLKIMDDDLAWEKYDQLVDGYFQMRQVIKESPDSLKLQIQQERAHAMLLNAKTRQFKLLMKTIKDKHLSAIAADVFGITSLEEVTGQKIDYRPECGKLYSAQDLATEIGTSRNMIGRKANAAGIKTDKYGMTVLSKSEHGPKQVDTFMYNECGRAKIKELFWEVGDRK
jgi:hypothetical protein